MRENFERSLVEVLPHEGGYANHPADPGGATMRGVTQATYNGWRAKQGLSWQSVRAISEAELQAIYRRDYWDAAGCDRLYPGVDFAVFDLAVNSGVGRARQLLAQAIGSNDHAETVRRLCDLRMQFLRGLRTWSTFGKGWASRVNDVQAKGVAWARAAMAQNVTLPPVAKPEVPMPPVITPQPKPWYLSRTVIGALIAIASPLLAKFIPAAAGIDPNQATTTILTLLETLGPLFGGALALIGRVGATNPIAGTQAAQVVEQRYTQALLAPSPVQQAQPVQEAWAQPQASGPVLTDLPLNLLVSQLPQVLGLLGQLSEATRQNEPPRPQS